MAVDQLSFVLDVVDGWPPVALECIPVRQTPDGYEVLASPLFVRDLSVGDVLRAELERENRVVSYAHAHRSRNSTVWLLRTGPGLDPSATLEALHRLGCTTNGLDAFGCYSVCVPSHVSMDAVDAVLDALPEESLAVAFPSFRHPE